MTPEWYANLARLLFEAAEHTLSTGRRGVGNYFALAADWAKYMEACERHGQIRDHA